MENDASAAPVLILFSALAFRGLQLVSQSFRAVEPLDGYAGRDAGNEEWTNRQDHGDSESVRRGEGRPQQIC